MGYYPESLWTDERATFDKVERTQWFGEVSAPPATTRPCSQMGTGRLPSSNASADEISGMHLLNGPRVSFWILITNDHFYGAERVPDTTYANAMKFGGPGARRLQVVTV